MDPSVEAGMDARTDGGGSRVGDGRWPRHPAACARGPAKAPHRPAPGAGQGKPAWRPATLGAARSRGLPPVGGVAAPTAGPGGASALAGGRRDIGACRGPEERLRWRTGRIGPEELWHWQGGRRSGGAGAQ